MFILPPIRHYKSEMLFEKYAQSFVHLLIITLSPLILTDMKYKKNRQPFDQHKICSNKSFIASFNPALQSHFCKITIAASMPLIDALNAIPEQSCC